ncbi:TetR/AcrR family transcriptional regulator [Clostridium sp. 19966]|uniref:TetR/AcrR family transcriptional regulator n=1 Tax=Clostridium sp. 19966 TaxID=2768166 RepID=UPI0028DD9147|nr:TetR/AcrR family transcriptional regulator [Clostridium sp. 19966]MDT8718009.1 TetR/AcrR family transcriptional regulator [Clostridium sp. 19966]
MEKKTSRAKQAEATKNKIYNCGVKLIKKHGFDGVTVEEIAKEAGVSVGTYYYYFKSKFDLFSEIFNRADKYFVEEVANNLKAEDFKGKVVEYFDRYADFNISEGLELTKNLHTSDNKMFITKGRGMQNVLNNIIEEAINRGEISPAYSTEDINSMLFITARGVIYEWCLYDGNWDLKGEMKKIIAIFLDGIIGKRLI